MSSKLIVVAGAAGRLGRLTIDALLRHNGVRVRALARDPAKLADLASDRVEVVAWDAAHPAADVVRGAFAVISTLQGGPDIIIEAQLALLRAARDAGARRFLPSDFSYNLFTLPAGVNWNTDWRRAFAEAAEAERGAVEVVHLMQGIFTDRGVAGFLGLLDVAAGTLRYWGDGATPIDWTTWEDTAAYAAAAAVDDAPVPAELFVAGERLDVSGVAAAWGDVHGTPLTPVRLGSLEDLAAETQARLAAEPHNLYAWLPLMYAQGVFGGQALLGPLSNDRWPQIQPETVAQAIRRGAL
jgi:nucleoside-diphosphate-sugar epimerase